MIKIDWVLLTYNRIDCVERSLKHNVKTAGYPINSFIHVDNGSLEDLINTVGRERPVVQDSFIQCSLGVNTGVSRGYNTGYSLSRADWVVITGCDYYMPDGWLKAFAEHATDLPETGVVCMSQAPLDHPDMQPLKLGQPVALNGHLVEPCLPFGRRMIRREILSKAGYLREDFGLYGYEDCEWGSRAWKYCRENGLITYSIPGMIPQDADTPEDRKAYKVLWDEKMVELRKGTGQAKLAECAKNNFPFYSPY